MPVKVDEYEEGYEEEGGDKEHKVELVPGQLDVGGAYWFIQGVVTQTQSLLLESIRKHKKIQFKSRLLDGFNL